MPVFFLKEEILGNISIRLSRGDLNNGIWRKVLLPCRVFSTEEHVSYLVERRGAKELEAGQVSPAENLMVI